MIEKGEETGPSCEVRESMRWVAYRVCVACRMGATCMTREPIAFVCINRHIRNLNSFKLDFNDLRLCNRGRLSIALPLTVIYDYGNATSVGSADQGATRSLFGYSTPCRTLAPV